VSDTLIDPKKFPGLSITKYAFLLQKDLKRLSQFKNKEHQYIYVRRYDFGTTLSDLLLFVDINDRKWRKHVPFLEWIADGKTDEERYAYRSSYGKCKVTAVGDLDGDGDDDLVISIITAEGRGAKKEKVAKLLNQGLFDGNDVYVRLSKEYKRILSEGVL
jgi:hypothetical protein